MNQSRIRYKSNGTTLISTRPILVNDKMVDVVIATNALWVNWFLAGTNVEAFPGQAAQTVAHAKKLAKSFLVEQGANFAAETRTRAVDENALNTVDDSDSAVVESDASITA